MLMNVNSIDIFTEKELKEEMLDMDQRAAALERMAAALRDNRRRLMILCCMSEHHRRWARPQDDFEHAHSELLDRPSIARKVLPPRRVPWSEQKED